MGLKARGRPPSPTRHANCARFSRPSCASASHCGFWNYFPPCFSHPRKSESDSFGAVTTLRSSQKRKNKKTMKHVMMKERNKTKTINETPALRRLGAFVWAALSANKTTVGALALLLLASQASADSFSFSTGDPDGKIATLSRPSSPGKIQTETADDFSWLRRTAVISQATFTGLLPLGAALTSISDVEIEIYHVFPGDSVKSTLGKRPDPDQFTGRC